LTDAVKARSVVSNAAGYVYKELQPALREALGSRTLEDREAGLSKGAIQRE
jgi:hypothetical protein